MKNKFILLIVIFWVVASSCDDLTLEPKGYLGEPELFGNEFGVTKYFTGIYNYLPIEEFNYFANGGYRQSNYWEAPKRSLGNMSGEFFNTWQGVDNDGFGYWPYDRIREVNVFINSFPNYKDKYDEATYNSLMGEARFLRAFFYEGMAKRYGGVPIVTEVQDPTGDKEPLMVSRATEYDTWKFIHDDLQFAIDNMRATSEVGRANKYVAAALMSRSMLYAGRVAKYTQYLGFDTEASVQQGFAGIEPAKANEFFQYSYDAGKLIEQSGKYSLYTKNYPDKATNFANLFLDVSSAENILIKDYDKNSPSNTYLRHNYDALMCPYPDMSSRYGSESNPPLDFMKMYDFPAITDANGKPVRFNSRSDIRNGMEPRLRGTMYFDGDELRGKIFSIQRGIYLTFSGLASDAQYGSNNAPVNAASNRKVGKVGETYNKVLITGAHGLFDNNNAAENNCMTGAYVRKYIDVNLPLANAALYGSGQHWVVFRLGEVYLNSAEAAYELGKRVEALDYIEKLRVRAGCQITRPALDQTVSTTYGYPIEASLQFIRDERARELYGENHWWWDLRLWRIVDQVLRQWYPHTLQAYYVFDEGKYIYLDEINKINRSWNASKSAAYEPIPQGEINKNPNLMPKNPLY